MFEKMMYCGGMVDNELCIFISYWVPFSMLGIFIYSGNYFWQFVS